MEIDVVTEAVSSVFGGSAPLFGASRAMAEHDERMTKPALLYGERVRLRSGNLFVHSQMTGFQVRLVMPLQGIILTARQLSQPAVRSVVADHVAPGDQLMTNADCEAIVDFWRLNVMSESFMTDLERVLDRIGDRLDASVYAVARACKAEQENLFSPGLGQAVETGLLEIRGHTEVPPNEATIVGEYFSGEMPEDYQQRALTEVGTLLSNPSTACLLDAWSAHVADHFGSVDTRVDALANEFGLQLLRNLPSIERATVAEVLDLRKSLSTPLVHFRAGMMEAAEEYINSDSIEDLTEYTNVFNERFVDPALSEIEDIVRTDTYVRQLLSVVTDPKDAVVSAGSLVLAASSAVGSASQILASAAGIGVPALHAYLESRRIDRDLQTRKFFLLHALGRRAGYESGQVDL